MNTAGASANLSSDKGLSSEMATRHEQSGGTSRGDKPARFAMSEDSSRSSVMSVIPFPKTNEGKRIRSRNRDKARREVGQASTDAPYKRKLIAFDAETWHALHLLGRDTMKDIQELADETFADVLKKYHRPTGLKDIARQSG
jgi:hypothetical protein